MVDEIVTRQELIDAKRDAQDLGKAVNEKAIVSPRYGEDFKSIPLIVEEGNQEIANLQDAIDIAAAAGAGANGWTAQLIVDEGGKTQQQINNAITKTFEYFNNDFIAAGEWLKESTANYVEIDASAYTLPTGAVYFNRYICKKGRVEINVPASTNLEYASFATDEVLHLEGINFYIEGHRMGVDSTAPQTVYSSLPSNTVCKTAKIKDVNVYGMKDGSYIDDAGRTRCCVFINYQVSESSEIQNIKTFGLRSFASVSAIGTLATHNDSKIICVNAETGIYYSPSTWLSGKISSAKIINTAEQKTYYIGMNTGLANNGKDVIMNAATYTVPLIVDDIYAKHAIERSIYIQSPDAQISNIVDEDSYSAGHTKINSVDAPIGKVKLSGIAAKNPTNLGAVFQTYGLAELDVDDLDIDFDSNLDARAVIIANTGDFTLRDSKIKNVATALYYNGGVGDETKSINIRNFEGVNCVSAVQPFVYGRNSTGVLDKLSIKDSSFKISKDIITISNTAMDCTNVKSLDISNTSFDIARSLFSYSATTTDIKLNDVILNVRNENTVAGIYASLLNPALAPVSANTFNITYNIESRHETNLNVNVKAHCSKSTDTGIVRCLDYWDSFDIEIAVSTAPAAYYLMPLGDVSYFVEARFDKSVLNYYYDATANTLTEQVNIGGKLATGARNADKITLKVSQANNYRLDIDVGQTTWTGGSGLLKVKVYR